MFRSSGDRASISMRARNFGSDEENDARRETSDDPVEIFISIISQEPTIVNVSLRDDVQKTDLNFLIAVHKFACDVCEISQESGESKGQTRER